ncbi:MAG: hypothetical protein K8S99_11520 [Planctomycetes bacterium]|nr:hypothetical protein [Planctomycetota bacterium]
MLGDLAHRFVRTEVRHQTPASAENVFLGVGLVVNTAGKVAVNERGQRGRSPRRHQTDAGEAVVHVVADLGQPDLGSGGDGLPGAERTSQGLNVYADRLCIAQAHRPKVDRGAFLAHGHEDAAMAVRVCADAGHAHLLRFLSFGVGLNSTV